MKQQSLTIDGWTIIPFFHERTGRLESVMLQFSAGIYCINELQIQRQPFPGEERDRILVIDNEIGFQMKRPNEEEKYGAWLQIDLANRPDLLEVFKDWLSR